MKSVILAAAVTTLLGQVSNAAVATLGVTEIYNPPVQEKYTSGAVHMSIMNAKESTWARQKAAGAFNSSAYTPVISFTPCVNGKAGEYRCNNIDLYSFTPHELLGSQTGEGSSSWGWTSPDGREIIIVAQADGAAFAEVNPDGSVTYLGRLPKQSSNSIWREIRVYKSYAVIGSEASNHGIQIFDLRQLLTVDPAQPKTFALTDAALFKGLPTGRTHNVVVNEEKEYAVSVGASPRTDACKSGLIFIDLKDPANPTSPGCAPQDGYVHDAQCIVYRGPDAKYNGRDICYGYNEDTLTIYDVTDKTNTSVISRTTYTGASYTHQGWVLDPLNQEYLLLDDEYDEYDKVGPARDGYPVTYIWDIKSLEQPVVSGYYKSGQKSIDHNQYIHEGKAYQSNYAAGLRVLDVSSIPSDPTGNGVKEIGFFDVYPEDDASGGLIDFVGTWSSYSAFKSGYLAINTIERGLFIVKLQN
ncbi:hypothetical protein BDN72DRAFT_871698 [Pluteus cervinus]|uniref:Uncharacterized protein n=1 Tax=Pluteus cervinus TaxID=181527 RepID=A0ACD3AJW2_9AGAR|nr:hypothetical protein BDN72DRAFT_871698 [Pluteus cervinus]